MLAGVMETIQCKSGVHTLTNGCQLMSNIHVDVGFPLGGEKQKHVGVSVAREISGISKIGHKYCKKRIM